MTHNKFTRFSAVLLLISAVGLSSPVFSEEENQARSVKPIDGELVLPDDYNKAEEKKCVTVCERWGEDCIINPRTGSRKCRRVCKSFEEECF